MASVHILNGGKLVFSPSAEPKAKLVSDNVIIDDAGEMWIGSSDCKFEGRAEVLLTGTYLNGELTTKISKSPCDLKQNETQE